MDFEKVLGIVIKKFEEEQVRYGLIGGFAMGALGISRSTVDLDFLVHRDDLAKVDKIMKDNGYECIFRSANVSQYISKMKIFGEIDFLHASRAPSLKMLESTITREVFEGKFNIEVVRPEDIIGLKIQALINDTEREEQEYADIESLMKYYRKNLDWTIIEDYFTVFDKQEKFTQLKRKYNVD